jgi:hypothetical protein
MTVSHRFIRLGLCLAARLAIAVLATAQIHRVAGEEPPKKQRKLSEQPGFGAVFPGVEARYRRTTMEKTGSDIHAIVVPAQQGDERLRVDTEDDEAEGERKAEEYYRTLAGQLGFKDLSGLDSCDALLTHLGYQGLTAADLEWLEPDILMDPEKLLLWAENPTLLQRTTKARPIAVGDILSIRFFSPKTTDVSHKVEPVAYSWRKLVRLKARTDSPAAKHNVDLLYFLTNVYEPDLAKNPFGSESRNNQVIVTGTKTAKWTLRWLVFGPTSQGARRQAYSETSWDAADPNLVGEVKKKYFVHISCVQCHGEDTDSARLQYLDTDHWLDRVEPDDDFAAVGASRWGALVDAGKDADSPRFERTMSIVKQLNREILAQNRLADEVWRRRNSEQAPPAGFQTRAAANWVLRLHNPFSGHVPPAERGIPSADQHTIWNPSNPAESALVRLLNQYCFRCHSSVRYHVFDKAAVLEVIEKETGRRRIDKMRDWIDAGMMPQDRELTEDEQKRLINALERVKASNAE